MASESVTLGGVTLSPGTVVQHKSGKLYVCVSVWSDLTGADQKAGARFRAFRDGVVCGSTRSLRMGTYRVAPKGHAFVTGGKTAARPSTKSVEVDGEHYSVHFDPAYGYKITLSGTSMLLGTVGLDGKTKMDRSMNATPEFLERIVEAFKGIKRQAPRSKVYPWKAAARIEVDTTEFEWSHGRKPSPSVHGGWAFALDGDEHLDHLFWVVDTYPKALAQAKAKAKHTVKVMP